VSAVTRKTIIRLMRLAGLLGFATTLAARCRHPRVTRYWFRAHHFARVCNDCELVIETGRDKSHRYPDDAQGVERGARVQAPQAAPPGDP